MDGQTETTADEVISRLDLKPHPEGGHYRETFRDNKILDGRAASTAIYFLLKAGERSHWHRVDAAEVWHHYAGAPLRLDHAPPGERYHRVMLGKEIASGECPQTVIEAGHWQRAESAGAWTLVGCTVAPGFDFARFELASQSFDIDPLQT